MPANNLHCAPFVWSGCRPARRRAVAVGDTAFIPPGEEHWHGAAADGYLVHIAISLGGADWLDAVTEAEYDDAAAQAAP